MTINVDHLRINLLPCPSENKVIVQWIGKVCVKDVLAGFRGVD